MMTAAFGGKDSARVVYPTRRNFVKYDGKDSVEISCDEFLEMPYKQSRDQSCPTIRYCRRRDVRFS